MDRPTPRQLQIFGAVAQASRLDAAARDLGISLETVRKELESLEASLGAALFQISEGESLRLSAHGEAALPAALRVVADYEALHAAVDAVPAKRAGAAQPIVVGAHPSIFARLRQELAAFEEEFPDRPLAMDFDCFTVEQVALAFSEGRVDLALFYALGETRAIPSHYLWSERWTLFVGPDHRLASRETVGGDDLAGDALLLSSPANRLRLLLDTCLVKGGLGNLSVAVESDDYALLARECRAGMGILPLFGPTAAQIGAQANLRRLAYVEQIPAIEVRRALHPRAAADESVQSLGELLKRGLEVT